MESPTWGQGTSAQGCASSSGSNSCAHLHAVAWGSQGLPQDPQAHTQGCTHPCYRLTLSSACKSACSAIPSKRW